MNRRQFLAAASIGTLNPGDLLAVLHDLDPLTGTGLLQDLVQTLSQFLDGIGHLAPWGPTGKGWSGVQPKTSG
ncbi:MAG TPA: hypothetical protein VF173_10365 [Thermoanaerobaculia bacterium]|nr:hypothetical protein [Thermoanaerobaculia bacterium]